MGRFNIKDYNKITEEVLRLTKEQNKALNIQEKVLMYTKAFENAKGIASSFLVVELTFFTALTLMGTIIYLVTK